MSILMSMILKQGELDRVQAATDTLLDRARDRGLISHRLYRSDNDPNRFLFLQEWESHHAAHELGDEIGDEFNRIIGARPEDWEDDAWVLVSED